MPANGLPSLQFATMVATTDVSVLAGYALACIKFRGRRLLLAVFTQDPEKVEPETYTIEGEVRDALGDPVPAAEVWVTDGDAPEVTLARGQSVKACTGAPSQVRHDSQWQKPETAGAPVTSSSTFPQMHFAV